ncbi:class F sortase [Pseudonocardia sp. McavD-2-B]|uniref:class F sortase n=1 Tax=Pseudonocardia sp. McavD-2-B TaxID=2954499 RepID=UPI0021116506|nr:class F sortase [Pseudonocardia sp. McavD-2-B]
MVPLRAPPGAGTGASVLADHVDDAVQGPGAFHQLDRLVPDDRIEVRDQDGALHRFEVISVSTYTKESLPVERMFFRGGTPRLHLITCGGPFDAARASYRDNVVVVAERRS